MNAAPPAHSFIWRRDRSEVNAFSAGAEIGGEGASVIVLEAIGPVGSLAQVGVRWSRFVGFGKVKAGSAIGVKITD